MKLFLLFVSLAAMATALECEPTENCDDCGDRYDTCLELSGVQGLPSFEICKKRAISCNPDACHACDSETYYPRGQQKEPPIEFPEWIHNG